MAFIAYVDFCHVLESGMSVVDVSVTNQAAAAANNDGAAAAGLDRGK
jgi:hypothetical protein